MNTITLIGHLSAPPAYHCTIDGRDLTRFQLYSPSTGDREGVVHHCQAWGPAALDLHQHLVAGEQMLVQGELRYRKRYPGMADSTLVPYVYVKGYSYLG